MAPPVNTARLRQFFVPEGGGLQWRPYAVVAAAGILAGAALGFSEPMQGLDWRLYDVYSRQIARRPDPAPDLVVVAIDEPSFTEIGLPWPWPRSLHAALVDRLREGG